MTTSTSSSHGHGTLADSEDSEAATRRATHSAAQSLLGRLNYFEDGFAKFTTHGRGVLTKPCLLCTS